MNYRIDQIRRLQYLLTDRWVTDDETESRKNFDALMRQIESPEELHQFAANFNWDCGHSELAHVIRHPMCDKGTAVMVYFLGKPEFYYKLQKDEEPFIGEMSLEFDFLKEIEALCEGDSFRFKSIRVDPRDIGLLHRDCLSKAGADLIPHVMKQPTSGEPLELLNLWNMMSE